VHAAGHVCSVECGHRHPAVPAERLLDLTLAAASVRSCSVSGSRDVTVEQSFGTIGSELTNTRADLASNVPGYGNGTVIEELSLKYGGYLRARRAATIIQQAYRQYSMSCSFAKLRLEAGESRRSRRFANRRTFDEKSNGEHQQHDAIPSQDVRKDATPSDNFKICDPVRRPAVERPAGLGLQIEDALTTVAAILMQQTSPSDDAAGDIYDDGGLSEHGGDCSSSRSLSPLPPPMEPVTTAGGDLPSVCFESMLDDESCGMFFGVAQKSSRLNAAMDCHPSGMLPSGLSSLQGGRSSHNIGIPKDASVKRFFDFPHLPAIGSNSNPQSQSINVNGQSKNAIRHQTNSSCASCGVVACGHQQTPAPASCSHRKHICPTSGCGTHANVHGPASNAGANVVNAPACGVATSSSCPFTNVPVSYFNLSSGGFHSESSPIWKRKSSSVESCDGNVGGCFASNTDDDFCRRERPWSDLYPGSTTSSEDAASIGSGSNNEMAPMSSHQHHFAYYRPSVECVGSEARVSSAPANASAPLSHNSLTDRQRKRSYRIGLNLFNK